MSSPENHTPRDWVIRFGDACTELLAAHADKETARATLAPILADAAEYEIDWTEAVEEGRRFFARHYDAKGALSLIPIRPPDPPELWSPARLVAATDIKDPEAFIGDDVASRATVTLLAGRRGSGKTYLLLHLASCIALGQPFGDLPCRQGRVLFLSQEMGKSAIRKRLRRMFTPETLAALEGHLDITCKLPFTLDSDAGTAPLIAFLQNAGPYDLIAIDTLRDVKGSARENDNDEMASAFIRLRDLVCEPLDLSSLLAHHKGKPPQDGSPDRGSRGASSMEDVAADVLYISKSDAGRFIDFEKTRDGSTEGKRLQFSITENPDDPTYITVDVHPAEQPFNSSFELEQLYSTLQTNGAASFSLAEIQSLMSWAHSTTRKYVSLATAAKRLKNTTTKPAKALYRYIPLSDSD